ncbi:MAG: phosphate ABC transporter permease subunit PstC [Rectinemataceae bacterium]|nr:phosphate ABC transporter permease subunit PstC [Rectinemataceae bacterium]
MTQVFPARGLARPPRPGEAVIKAFLFSCAAFSILTTAGIVLILGKETFSFFKEVSIVEFLTGSLWQPAIGKFGILPLASATLVTSLIAMAVALPLGLMVAVYLSEYAPWGVRQFLKPTLEVLAGIPTVVYGYFALSTVTPLLRGMIGQDRLQVYNMLSAGLVMGILILPLIASMCEDALSAVPRTMREAAYATGATKLEVTTQVVVPAAFSGLAAAFILGLSRAVGETMIVALAAGAGPNLTLNPLKSAETMTGHIVRISGGDLSYDTIDYSSLFAIAATLFVITMILNLISRRIVGKRREVYE